jgi:hypothetical protein
MGFSAEIAENAQLHALANYDGLTTLALSRRHAFNQFE